MPGIKEKFKEEGWIIVNIGGGLEIEVEFQNKDKKQNLMPLIPIEKNQGLWSKDSRKWNLKGGKGMRN